VAESIPRIVFVMTGACGATGGVAAVNVQVLRALSRLAGASRIDLSVLSFTERVSDRPPFLPASVEYHAFAGRKGAMAKATLGYALRRPVFFFDYLRLALPVLPLVALGWGRAIVFAHGQEYWKDIRWTDRLTLRSASLVVANSHFTLRKMRNAVGEMRAVACPLGLPEQLPLNDELSSGPQGPLELRACDGRDRLLGERVLLLVGRVESRERGKGHEEMLAVLPELLSRFPDVQLVFAGPGDDRSRLTRVADRLRVSHAVFMPGYMEPQMLAALYRRCYAFTMPSRQEGFGLVYLEAMNFAKPCLGCWDDGAEDVIVHGQTGHLVRDPKDRTEVAAALSDLLADPAKATQMGLRGFELLRSRFTAEHFRARVIQHLEPFLNVGAGATINGTVPLHSEGRQADTDRTGV